MEIPDFGSSLVDVAIRTAIVYVVLIVGLRIAGKREVGQLSIFDLIVLLVIADAVQNSMVGENTTLPAASSPRRRSSRLDKLLDMRVEPVPAGPPGSSRASRGELIRDGVADERRFARKASTTTTSPRSLRAHGVLEPSEVRSPSSRRTARSA